MRVVLAEVRVEGVVDARDIQNGCRRIVDLVFALLSSSRMPLVDRTDAIDILVVRGAKTALGRCARGKGALAYMVLLLLLLLRNCWRAEPHHEHQHDHEFAFHGLPFQARWL